MSHQYNLSHSNFSTNEVLLPNSQNPHVAIESINSYIDNVDCENFSIDISYMNILDACYVSTMCSTKHYIKYPHGHINWIVSSDSVKDFCKDMSLGNTDFYRA